MATRSRARRAHPRRRSAALHRKPHPAHAFPRSGRAARSTAVLSTSMPVAENRCQTWHRRHRRREHPPFLSSEKSAGSAGFIICIGQSSAPIDRDWLRQSGIRPASRQPRKSASRFCFRIHALCARQHHDGADEPPLHRGRDLLTDGEDFVDQFTEARISDPDLGELAARVHVEAAPDIDAPGTFAPALLSAAHRAH
jgi:hypothetical protein